VVDAGGVDDQAAAGAQALVSRFGNPSDFAAGAGHEHAIGVGQLVEGWSISMA
jgi:hypothetical protein